MKPILVCASCQNEKANENVIQIPEACSCESLWKAISKRASYFDGKYTSIIKQA